jgi:preprotein translocase SecE subunit
MVTTSMASNGPTPDEPNDQAELAKAGPKDSKASEPGTARARGGSIPAPRMKRGLRGFLIEVQREMKKVSWPTRPETNRLTVVVLSVCLLLVAFLLALGFVFGFVIDIITKGTPR